MKIKKCFADCAGLLQVADGNANECVTCDLFERCYKATICVAIQNISVDIQLITQNGLCKGWLQPFKDLYSEDS